jgi:5-carboxymethyl-2-hydroxymuconate isomerase
MPHQIIEYSDNLDSVLDIDELVAVLHEAAAAVEAFPLAGLRTRAVARSKYRIADNHTDNSFVHVVMRIGRGRELEVRQKAGKQLFDTLCEFLQPIQSGAPLAISYEMQEIDTDVRWNKNNLRDYIAERGK